ncbi:MAG: peptide chain release factor N(5)-glutamine methyltransferase [Ardenticatenaceae bacterium]|nr:peptide chain release factor N(5)-glutamine methyltransferase [Ardenticatenaceae bacterium]MCB9444210.1 peptide chain release factor N(5)-glutamine methyltransferase [Ardenticatenaceae bacterium]
MNVSEAWTYGRSHLPHSPNTQLDVRLLLEYVLGVNHSWLVAHDDEELTAVQQAQYRQLIERAARQEPIPYLVGHAPFFDLDFIVTPVVLIPRPETEQLVDLAADWARKRPSGYLPCRIVDVGTGSGCIAVTLASRLPLASVEAVDISAEALAVAQQNARQHAPDRIRFHQGHLLEPIQQPADLLAANLPYVTDAEWTMLDDGVKWYEPAAALKGGADGLDLIRQLLQQAVTKLNPGAAIFLEIGWQQGTAVHNLAHTIFPAAQVELVQDFAGHDRIVVIKMMD